MSVILTQSLMPGTGFQDECVKIDFFFWFVKTFVLLKNFQSQVRVDGETTYTINEIGMGIVALRIWVKK